MSLACLACWESYEGTEQTGRHSLLLHTQAHIISQAETEVAKNMCIIVYGVLITVATTFDLVYLQDFKFKRFVGLKLFAAADSAKERLAAIYKKDRLSLR